MKRVAALILLCTMLVMALSGCAGKADTATADVQKTSQEMTLRIADQYGLAYAPLMIMKEKQLIEKHNEGLSVEWKKLGNTAAIREAMLAGDLDVGFLGIPPFIIGYDNGMEWQMFTGLSSAPLGLAVNRAEIKSLKDITADDKIALPQPGSIQHILLSMAAERQFGDAKRFDNQLVTMKHPDGFNALIAGGEIAGHFTSPPYIFEEAAMESNHVILTGEEAMGGPFTFIVGMAGQSVIAENPEVMEGIRMALTEANTFILESPEETLDILSAGYGIEKEKLSNYIYEQGIVYTTEMKGVQTFSDFLHQQEYTKKAYEASELIWSEK